MTVLSKFPSFQKRSKRFRRDEDGGMTIFGLYVLAGMAVIGGLAVDFSNLIAERTKLQMTADTVAHAALYNRDWMDADTATTAALNVAAASMPSGRYGDVLTADDIHFGYYDPVTEEFQINPASRSAVMVSLRRAAETENAVSSFLMQFAGFSKWDITTQAVFVTYRPACLREGFVATDVVDIQSNNGFTNGFCIHSNTHVSLNSNNSFEAGTIVSMPDLAALDLPKSGFATNEGLEAALREGRMHLRILDQMDSIANELLIYGSEAMPDYITDFNVYRHTAKKLTAADLVPGTLNYIDCNGKVTINGTDGPIRDVVFYSECDVTFAQGVVLEDVVGFTASSADASFNSVSGLQIGRDDSCAPGGGVQLLTRGGMRFPADLQIYGGQLVALGPIKFAANANGVEGASMISGSTIDGTSNMEMAFCGTGMESNFEAEYFRLAH